MLLCVLNRFGEKISLLERCYDARSWNCLIHIKLFHANFASFDAIHDMLNFWGRRKKSGSKYFQSVLFNAKAKFHREKVTLISISNGNAECSVHYFGAWNAISGIFWGVTSRGQILHKSQTVITDTKSPSMRQCRNLGFWGKADKQTHFKFLV